MIGKFESNKDLVQELTSSGARHVGNIAALITGVVAEVAREIGEFVTDAIEMNEAAAAARRDAEQHLDVEPEFGRAVDLDEPAPTVFADADADADVAPGDKADKA
ncbi:hypothetical protein [Nocardia sp. NPDC050717]|uniref:hypothetical protein n=1 Tax=Nocardia sp. NPDC050717 TaxID=3157221 RepID=UPI0033E28C06